MQVGAGALRPVVARGPDLHPKVRLSAEQLVRVRGTVDVTLVGIQVVTFRIGVGGAEQRMARRDQREDL